MGDDLIGSVEDVGGAAVVLLQLDDHSVRIVLLKIENVADIRAAPAVDALVVIADNADIAAVLRKQLDQRILGEVGVLILVHVDVAELVAVALQNGRMIRKQLQRFHQQIVKI